jgi:Na+/melibiose symporter-like transporter
MGRSAAPSRASPPLTPAIKFAYGAGSAAFGIKDAGFSYFLLLFYSQVVGLDARLVGGVLTVALLLDAASDPVVGYWSDRFRSRWGRRHPFMYAAIAPTALSFGLLWAPPPGLSETALLVWLAVFAVLTRTAITFFETPSAALGPELTQDYVERSSLLSYRSFFGWTGGNAMTVLMFAVLFPAFATTQTPNGQFSREAYGAYGVIAASIMLLAMIVSAAGTHGRIPTLSAAPPPRPQRWAERLSEIRRALANPSFMALLAAGVIGAVAGGLSASLSVYFSTFFWGFSPQQISLITLAIFLSAFLGAALAPWVTRTLGKTRGAALMAAAAALISPAPIILKLAGLLETGSSLTFVVVFLFGQLDVCLVVCMQVLIASMMSDIADDSEVRTGRRSEGLFFSANTFIAKAVAGLGVMAAAQVLELARFPPGAQPQDVDPDALFRLGLAYAPLMILLRLGGAGILLLYRLDRRRHEANLALLKARRETAAGSDQGHAQ